MSMDIDFLFTPLNDFMSWVQDQLAGGNDGGSELPGGTGSAA